ncbi:MAG: hypothetical protein GXP14_11860, partial [Gammaproteobacteria bacterium]|nr:hypothetical protein [Gammaproteobacteria bacterium]
MTTDNQQSTDLNEFINDVEQFSQDYSATIATAFSNYVNTMRDQANANFTEQQRLQMLSDIFLEQSEYFAQRADEISANALQMGDEGRASAWQNAAQEMRDYAAQINTMSTEAQIEAHGLSISNTMELMSRYGGPVGDAVDYARIVQAVRDEDWDSLGQISTSALYGVLGAYAGGAIVAGFGVSFGWIAAGAVLMGAIGGSIGEWVWDQLSDGARSLVTDALTPVFEFWDQAINWIAPPPRDPLALDLDGDGIETLAANGYGGVLFDQNGDGVKRATGWVASDDGLLALDRNGNGTIDNGTELFGNSTPTAGGTAADGLSALADLDTNADGRVDASD